MFFLKSQTFFLSITASFLLYLALIVAAQENSCDIVRCGYGARCEIVDNRPQCVCPTICPDNYSPVCGNDGKTYSNSCQMIVRGCEEKRSIIKASNGECPPAGSPTTSRPIKLLPTRISPGIGVPKFASTTAATPSPVYVCPEES